MDTRISGKPLLCRTKICSSLTILTLTKSTLNLTNVSTRTFRTGIPHFAHLSSSNVSSHSIVTNSGHLVTVTSFVNHSTSNQNCNSLCLSVQNTLSFVIIQSSANCVAYSSILLGLTHLRFSRRRL